MIEIYILIKEFCQYSRLLPEGFGLADAGRFAARSSETKLTCSILPTVCLHPSQIEGWATLFLVVSERSKARPPACRMISKPMRWWLHCSRRVGCGLTSTYPEQTPEVDSNCSGGERIERVHHVHIRAGRSLLRDSGRIGQKLNPSIRAEF